MNSICLSTVGSRASFVAFLFLLFSCSTFTSTGAYDRLDPNGNITLKWDIMSWTADGYVVNLQNFLIYDKMQAPTFNTISDDFFRQNRPNRTASTPTMYNYQRYRGIQKPGWTLGWTWAKKEIIWNMLGSQTTEQGDCSKFKAGIPHCCKKDPTVVDLFPGTPYNQQVANCCKGGVLSSWAQNPRNAVSSFQASVGSAGTTNGTVALPRNFTLRASGPGYTCGPAKIVKPTQFITSDKRRVIQALMTWNVIYNYSHRLQ